MPFETFFFTLFPLLTSLYRLLLSDPFSYLTITLPDTVSEYYFIFSFLKQSDSLNSNVLVVGDPAHRSSHPHRKSTICLAALPRVLFFFLPFSLPRIRLTQTSIGFSLFGSNPSRTYSFVLLALILYYISFPVPFLHTYQPPVISHSSPPFFCFRRKGSSSILFPYCLSCLTLYTSICLVGACVWFP